MLKKSNKDTFTLNSQQAMKALQVTRQQLQAFRKKGLLIATQKPSGRFVYNQNEIEELRVNREKNTSLLSRKVLYNTINDIVTEKLLRHLCCDRYLSLEEMRLEINKILPLSTQIQSTTPIFRKLKKFQIYKKGFSNQHTVEFRMQSFIDKANLKHNFKYCYSKMIYINGETPIEITCPIHGSFWKDPTSHWSMGVGCPTCSTKPIWKHTQDSFLKKALEYHGTLYDYSKVNFINSDIKVTLICPIHKDFKVTPKSHLVGKNGCPKCNRSKGEFKVACVLELLEIEFVEQKRFDNLRAYYDFYLPKYNLCIEYDGSQHFHVYRQWQQLSKEQKIETFAKQQIRDKRKDNFCKQNQINLVRIPYTDFSKINTNYIKELLKQFKHE